MNKCTIVGRLGTDVELRATKSGKLVADMRIATNESWTDAEGKKQTKTEWHRVVVWGKQAENCKEYLSKGRQVCVEGRLQTRQWEDTNGNKRWTTEIVASSVEFLGGSGGTKSQEENQPPPIGEDDIPF